MILTTSNTIKHWKANNVTTPGTVITASLDNLILIYVHINTTTHMIHSVIWPLLKMKQNPNHWNDTKTASETVSQQRQTIPSS